MDKLVIPYQVAYWKGFGPILDAFGGSLGAILGSLGGVLEALEAIGIHFGVLGKRFGGFGSVLGPPGLKNSALACTAALCLTKIVLSPAREPGQRGLEGPKMLQVASLEGL